MFNRYNIGVLERNTGCILYLSSLHFFFFWVGVKVGLGWRGVEGGGVDLSLENQPSSANS